MGGDDLPIKKLFCPEARNNDILQESRITFRRRIRETNHECHAQCFFYKLIHFNPATAGYALPSTRSPPSSKERHAPDFLPISRRSRGLRFSTRFVCFASFVLQFTYILHILVVPLCVSSLEICT